MRTFLICLILITCFSAVVAQDSTERHQLTEPTSDEYLQAVVELAPRIDPQLKSTWFGSNAHEQIWAALRYLFPVPTQTHFDSLVSAYSALDMGHTDGVARGEWVRRMVENWIAENGINLSTVASLDFEDFHIDVLPRDFDADGEYEYVLDVSKGGRVDRATESCLGAEVSDYMVADLTANGYRFVETGLPWKGYAVNGRYSYANGGMIELGFEDLTGDSLPEWIILVGAETAGGPGMGYVDGGGLLILSWRDGQLQFVVPSSYAPNRRDGVVDTDFLSTELLCSDMSGPFPATVSWEFTNIDSDAALEIQQSQRYTDNWSCERTETKIFDWDGNAEQYIYTDTQTTYRTETQVCQQRSAEEIMWTGDYARAIPMFERALELETDDLTPGQLFNYERSLNQYLRARLAFAYVMTGQGELADPMLESLTSETTEETPVQHFIDLLNAARRTHAAPLDLCIDAYNLFTTEFLQIRVGYTGDDLYYYDNPYLPENIGCNAPEVLQNELRAEMHPSASSPVDALERLGVGIIRSLELDLNDDGQSEWLVWTEVAGLDIL